MKGRRKRLHVGNKCCSEYRTKATCESEYIGMFTLSEIALMSCSIKEFTSDAMCVYVGPVAQCSACAHSNKKYPAQKRFKDSVQMYLEKEPHHGMHKL